MRAVSLEFLEEVFVVVLETGERLVVPYTTSERLAKATHEQRATARLIGKGSGVHWPLIDEDLSVRGLFVQHNQGAL
jgi:hypothetical protein